MYEACVELGVREAPDLNAADGQAGVVGAMPHNRYKEVRLGTLVTYLRAARRAAQSDDPRRLPVDRLLLVRRDGDQGVVYLDAARRADTASMPTRSCISAGVYNSPAILQRSGIGPAEWLRAARASPSPPICRSGATCSTIPAFGMRFRGEGLGVTDRALVRRQCARPRQRRRRAGMADPPVPDRRRGADRRLLDLSHAPGSEGDVRIQAPIRRARR